MMTDGMEKVADLARREGFIDLLANLQLFQHEHSLAMDGWATRMGTTNTGVRAIISIGTARNPVTPSDLGRHLGLTTGSVTTLVHGLVAKGYVVREPNERDKRSVYVLLTEQGRAAEEEFISQYARALMGSSDPDHAAIVAGFLAAGHAAIRAEFAEPTTP